MVSGISGLYVVTDEYLLGQQRFEIAVRAALMGGTQLIQFRDKIHDANTRRDAALTVRKLCHQYSVPLIVNDDVDMAMEIGADGVHLGAYDISCAEARSRLGTKAIVGISCYNSLEKAQRAQNDGASYIALGSFYPSPTKPTAERASLATLQQAKKMLDIPVVAIGGITPENGRILVDAGADALAVVSGVLRQSDPCNAARCFAKLFGQHPA